VVLVSFAVLHAAWAVEKTVFEPTWESVKARNPAPEWFRDAKFGIYFHWGVYCVPAFGSEWYPRNMHIKKNREYKHHVETYGEPSEFGYHDFVPLFKAEHFDADAWAELFERAGARFAGPVAEHHDGFAMWASKLTPWNAQDKGPKRDLTGELAKAVRKRGMRFVATFHHARNSQHQVGEGERRVWTGHYPRVEGWPTVSEDPELRLLYGNIPREDFLEMWKGKLIEVIDQYQPDLMWFDSWLDEIPDEHKLEYLAYYFNHAREHGKEVVVTVKQRDLPHEIAVEDFEKGRADRLTDYTWLTDDTISYGSWCYTENLRIKPTSEVVHVLIDIVSKNGQLLLNISPKADGTIPQEQQDVLLGIGKWLEACGEAIYGTRPFVVFGEGPTRLRKGGHFVRAKLAYGPEDIRFTRKGNVVYAMCLGWPEREVTIRSLGGARAGGATVRDVALLGSDAAITWSQNDDGLHLSVPDTPPCDYACAFKIVLEGAVSACSGVELTGSGQMTATVRVLNLSDEARDTDVALLVDGEAAARSPVSVAAGAEQTCRVAGPLPAEGVHQVQVVVGGAVVAEQQVLTPIIGLTDGWRFHEGDDETWRAPDLDDSGWRRVKLPEPWEKHGALRTDPAYGWYRKHVAVPQGWKGRDLILPLGEIDDADETYFNGRKIGGGGRLPPRYQTAWQEQRRYRVPARLVRFGADNVIAVRVYDGGGEGGFRAGPLGPVELAGQG